MKTVVVGLGCGDEGKGTITDFLARQQPGARIVRFNGGPQAGHNVVTPEGTWHCFAQFGAGLLCPGTTCASTEDVLVELEALRVEGEALVAKGVTDAFERITLSARCTVITPFHKMLCQLREAARGGAPKGTCGMGVGEAVRMRERGLFLTVGEASDAREKLAAIKTVAFQEAEALREASPEIYDWFRARGDVDALSGAYRDVLSMVRVQEVVSGDIFEGAQGALLDRTRGVQPYVTPADTTHLAASARAPDARVIGVLRPFAHRHGPGPLPTEVEVPAFHDPRNPTNRWQGPFRVGWLDLPALRYGLSLNPGVSALAITNLDRMSGLEEIPVCVAPGEYVRLPGWREDIAGVCCYDDLPTRARRYVEFIETALGVPLAIVSVTPTAEGKLTR
ncbi:MAG: adenylosuccinate synthetase [Armatimonadetes bacterium]|nr:adenylosuccinate synthetase [Armatimonadota bacterium]